MRSKGALALVVVLLAACAEGLEVDSTLGPTAAIGPSATVATSDGAATTSPTTAATTGGNGLTVEGSGYSYSLDEADGCYRLEVRGEGMETLVEERCPPPGFWYTTSPTCAERQQGTTPGDPYASVTTLPCPRVIPRVLYGFVPEEIGYLCLPSQGEQPGEFGPVRFVARSPSGLLLAALDDAEAGTTPFPYTPDGLHWGEPPLDAPAWVIYAQCDAAGPWATPAFEVPLEMLVQLDSEAARPGQVLTIDPGTGGTAFDLGAFAPDTSGLLPLRLPGGAEEVRLAWADESGESVDLGALRLPDEIAAEAASGWACPDAPVLVLAVAPGHPVAVALDWLPLAEAYARLGFPAGATDRLPGDPCPGAGHLVATEGAAEFGPAFEGAYRFVVAPEVLALGPAWMIDARGLHSGYALDMGHLAAAPDQRWWGYLFPGTMLEIGIVPSESEDESGMIEIPIPDIPTGLDGPYLLVVTVSGYADEGGQPRLAAEYVALRWEQDAG